MVGGGWGFANLFGEVGDATIAARSSPTIVTLVTGIDDGLEAVRFVDACICSDRHDAACVDL